MATELPPRVVETPTAITVVTPVVRRPILGRVYDAFLIGCAFLAALLASLGDVNFVSLGFTQTQAAWLAVALFSIRFALAWRPVRVDVRAEPVEPRRDGI